MACIIDRAQLLILFIFNWYYFIIDDDATFMLDVMSARVFCCSTATLSIGLPFSLIHITIGVISESVGANL